MPTPWEPFLFLLLTMASPLLAAPLPDPADLPARSEYPDPLTMQDGSRVATKEEWSARRAPELRELFLHYEYGHPPAAPARVEAKVERDEASALGGAARLREVTLTWGMPGVAIHLLLYTPVAVPRAPVFLGLSFAPVQEALEEGGKLARTWNIQGSIARGYAVALMWNGDVVPDQAEQAKERLKLFRPAERADAPAPDDCATIAAWAWGLSRAVDYLVQVPEIDAGRIALVGHSRNGKTALLAAALDPRVALTIAAQAGCGGTAPSRLPPEVAHPPGNGHPTVETVERINTVFPHWFCELFHRFNTETARLPFDQHELIALCAPRPVLVSAATEDAWANPPGQFAMLQGADPVYRLVAGDGLAASEMPAPSQPVPSRLGFFLRPGIHEMNELDWKMWLDYADRWLK